MRVLTTVFDVRQSTLNLAKMPVECGMSGAEGWMCGMVSKNRPGVADLPGLPRTFLTLWIGEHAATRATWWR